MSITVADLVAEFLAALGVATVFGVASGRDDPIREGILRRGASRFVPARSEAGAGHMADAFARVSGGLGVVVTGGGPGAASAVPALVEARAAGSPLLHITGQTATEFLGRDNGTAFDVPGQGAIMAATCKAVYRPLWSFDVLDMLVAAATDALTAPAGPVTVEIPFDLQRLEMPRPAALDRLALDIPKGEPLAEDLDDLADILAGARRPMLWLGRGARAAGEAALGLLELGFGAVSSQGGRGIVPEDHPRMLGAPHGDASLEAFYETVDVMLVAGSRLRGSETRNFALRLPKTLVQVDVDEAANGRTYAATAFVTGDAALVLAGLGRRLAGRIAVDPGFGADLARARAEVAAPLPPAAELRRAVPRDTVLVGDTVAARSMPVHGQGRSLRPVVAAGGACLPLAIGTALAAGSGGRRTVLLAGRDGLVPHMAELWTAAGECPDLCIVVTDDGTADGPDPEALAGLAGLPFFRADRIAGPGEAVGRAVATPGPALVGIDMRSIGAVPGR